MRIFIGVELASASREAIGTFVSSLRRSPASSGTSVTWVPTSNLHITLRLGIISESGEID